MTYVNMTWHQCPEEEYVHRCQPIDSPNITCPRKIHCPAENWADEDFEFQSFEEFAKFENNAYYWIDGVVLCPISIIGLLLNMFGIVILSRYQSMRNVFNQLLISLFVFDSTYILTTLMNQSLMVQFNIMPRYSQSHVIIRSLS